MNICGLYHSPGFPAITVFLLYTCAPGEIPGIGGSIARAAARFEGVTRDPVDAFREHLLTRQALHRSNR